MPNLIRESIHASGETWVEEYCDGCGVTSCRPKDKLFPHGQARGSWYDWECPAYLQEQLDIAKEERQRYFECAQGTRCFTCMSTVRYDDALGNLSSCSSAWHFARTGNDWQKNLDALIARIKELEAKLENEQEVCGQIVDRCTELAAECIEAEDALEQVLVDINDPHPRNATLEGLQGSLKATEKMIQNLLAKRIR